MDGVTESGLASYMMRQAMSLIPSWQNCVALAIMTLMAIRRNVKLTLLVIFILSSFWAGFTVLSYMNELGTVIMVSLISYVIFAVATVVFVIVSDNHRNSES